MRRYFVDFGLVIVLTAVLIAAILYARSKNYTIQNPIAKKVTKIIEKPLERYTFERLKKTEFEPQDITFGENVITDRKNIESYTIIFSVPDPKDQDKKYKVSGLINFPQKKGVYPIIVMLRGFVPKEEYKVGVGTKRAGEYFAENGYITVAPDFLGYGESENPSDNSMEERFQTYTTTLSLLASLGNINKTLQAIHSGEIQADTSKVGIWGHSNGGHIALSVLAISGAQYPTVLWNPVTKPFPYSILYFTDEFEDEGKALRKLIADFERDYDVFAYSPPKYYDWIQAPIQLHQGENDPEVPKIWSDEFIKKMDDMKKTTEYFTYKNADHNLQPDGWDLAVRRSVEFYRKNFEEK